MTTMNTTITSHTRKKRNIQKRKKVPPSFQRRRQRKAKVQIESKGVGEKCNKIYYLFPQTNTQFPMAYILVYCFAVSIACALLVFQTFATSFARGSSGFGSLDGEVSLSLSIKLQSNKPQKRLDTQENSANLESRGPSILQDVQANSSKLINIGMVQLCEEANLKRRMNKRNKKTKTVLENKNLWRNHGVISRKKQLQFENASFIWGRLRASNDDIKVSQVLSMRFGRDPRSRFLHKSLCFLKKKKENKKRV